MGKYFKRSEYAYGYGLLVDQTKISATIFLQEYNKFRQMVPAGSPLWNEVEEQVKVSKWLDKAYYYQYLGTSHAKLTAFGYRELPNALSHLNEGLGYLYGVRKLRDFYKNDSEFETEEETKQTSELDF